MLIDNIRNFQVMHEISKFNLNRDIKKIATSNSLSLNNSCIFYKTVWSGLMPQRSMKITIGF